MGKTDVGVNMLLVLDAARAVIPNMIVRIHLPVLIAVESTLQAVKTAQNFWKSRPFFATGLKMVELSNKLAKLLL